MRLCLAIILCFVCCGRVVAEQPSLRKVDSFPKDYVGKSFTYVVYLAHDPFMKSEMESTNAWEIRLLDRNSNKLTNGGTFIDRDKLCVLVDEQTAKSLIDQIPPNRLRKFSVTFTVREEKTLDTGKKFFAGRVTALRNLGEAGPPAEQ